MKPLLIALVLLPLAACGTTDADCNTPGSECFCDNNPEDFLCSDYCEQNPENCNADGTPAER